MAINKKINSRSIVMAIIIVLFYFFGLIGTISPSNNSSQKADGFTIENFDLVLDVKEDNKIDVTEKITVNWYELGHHGIYRFIPTWLQYTGKNGKTIKRKSTISNLQAIGEQYIINNNVGRDKIRIKIGSASKTLPLGLYTYTINYTYDMGEDPYKNFDEFIFHAYGDFWGTSIKNATLQVNMPKSFDTRNIKFFKDKKRNTDITSQINYYVSGNTLYASGTNLNESLTVDIDLPEGYFVGGSNNYGTISKTISAIILIGTIAMLFVWYKYGRDNEKVPETVEFYPPDELDAAEIGYIYGKQPGKKLTIALIVGLASKGYIRIEESEDKKTRKIIDIAKEETTKEKPKLTEAEDLVYRQLFAPGEKETDLSTNTTFYQTFDLVSLNLDKRLKYKINDAGARTAKVISWCWTILCVVFSMLSYFALADLKPQLNYLYMLAFIATGVSIFLSFIMDRKTMYGEIMTSRVSGFKDYLQKAEKEELEAQVNENPNYFYDILPYAYVLNVSKEWINKFENIPMPENYMGNFDYRDTSSFDRIYDSVYYPVSTGSGSGGCSSCGGGCSSCGGGCSSCGGGGSW